MSYCRQDERRTLARMKLLIALAVCVAAVPAFGYELCPDLFDIPFPHSGQNGYSWGKPIRPLGDPCITHIGVEQADENTWYAGGWQGVYVTRDAGRNWSLRLKGEVKTLLVTESEMAYAAIGSKVYRTIDHGATWTLLRNFKPAVVTALLVSGDVLVVGASVAEHGKPGGVWIGSLDGQNGNDRSYAAQPTCLITRTLAIDPKRGTLYAGTENCKYRPGYRPPFFRSDDGGLTWKDVGAPLQWYAIAAAVPSPDHLYVQLEGGGFFSSADRGETWQKGPLPKTSGQSFLMDTGRTFRDIGLGGASVSGLALNAAGTKLYACVYGRGIYVSPVP